MNRSLILSNLRIELRRKQAKFLAEKNSVNWIKAFFDEMSIAHSSQIRSWQKELFISRLRNNSDISREELLQAESALTFLYDRVLKQSNGFVKSTDDEAIEPGVFRITA